MPFGRARDLDMYDICATERQIFVKYEINVLKKSSYGEGKNYSHMSYNRTKVNNIIII